MAAFRTQSWVIGAGAAAASLSLAALTRHFVEEKVRFNRRLLGSNPLTFSTAAAGAALILTLSGSVYVGGEALTASRDLAVYQTAISSRGATHCPHETTSVSGIVHCESGERFTSRTVMLVGDSHAGHWQDSFSDAASAEGYSLTTRWRSACPAIPVAIVNAQFVRDPECDSYRTDTLRLVDELKPDVVVIADANSYLDRVVHSGEPHLSTDEKVNLWGMAYKDFVRQLRERGAVVASIQDSPQLDFDPNLCLTRVYGSEAVCSPTREAALESTAALRGAESAALDSLGVTHLFKTVDKLCNRRICAVKIGSIPIYADPGHLSSAWTHSQEANVRGFLQAAMVDTPRP